MTERYTPAICDDARQVQPIKILFSPHWNQPNQDRNPEATNVANPIPTIRHCPEKTLETKRKSLETSKRRVRSPTPLRSLVHVSLPPPPPHPPPPPSPSSTLPALVGHPRELDHASRNSFPGNESTSKDFRRFTACGNGFLNAKAPATNY